MMLFAGLIAAASEASTGRLLQGFTVQMIAPIKMARTDARAGIWRWLGCLPATFFTRAMYNPAVCFSLGRARPLFFQKKENKCSQKDVSLRTACLRTRNTRPRSQLYLFCPTAKPNNSARVPCPSRLARSVDSKVGCNAGTQSNDICNDFVF